MAACERMSSTALPDTFVLNLPQGQPFMFKLEARLNEEPRPRFEIQPSTSRTDSGRPRSITW